MDHHRNRALILALAATAGLHAGLAPVHGPSVGAMFVLTALVLAGAAVSVDRGAGPAALGLTALLLGGLLAAYAASRFVVLPPLTHAEPVDVAGAVAKSIEAAALVLVVHALRRGGARA